MKARKRRRLITALQSAEREFARLTPPPITTWKELPQCSGPLDHME